MYNRAISASYPSLLLNAALVRMHYTKYVASRLCGLPPPSPITAAPLVLVLYSTSNVLVVSLTLRQTKLDPQSQDDSSAVLMVLY